MNDNKDNNNISSNDIFKEAIDNKTQEIFPQLEEKNNIFQETPSNEYKENQEKKEEKNKIISAINTLCNKINFKDNKTKIIIAIIAILTILLLLTRCNSDNNFSSNNGYTAKNGTVLKVNEREGTVKFNLQVLSIEENYTIKNSSISDGNYTRIKVNIKNLGREELSLITLNFHLYDSKDDEISLLNTFEAFLLEDSIPNTINKKSSATGYLYFKNNSSDINKLKVSVIKNAKEEHGKLIYEREDYYLILN